MLIYFLEMPYFLPIVYFTDNIFLAPLALQVNVIEPAAGEGIIWVSRPPGQSSRMNWEMSFIICTISMNDFYGIRFQSCDSAFMRPRELRKESATE